MSQLLKGKELIAENDDLVVSRLMELHQIVTSHVLIGIVKIQGLFHILIAFLIVVSLIEIRSHFTPNFNTLDSGKIPLGL